MPPDVRLSAARSGPATVNRLARRAGLRIGRLRPDDLPDAQRLLYRVYFEELGWDPCAPNASNLRADHGTQRFIDDFDATAVWIGLFNTRDSLVGVLRLIEPDANGGLEMTRYVDLALGSAIRTAEVNRVALLPAWRSGAALGLLWFGGAWIARRQGFGRVIGSVTQRVFDRSARHGGWRVMGAPFRYHPEDPEPVLPLTFAPTLSVMTEVVVGKLAHQARRARRGRRPQTSKV